VSRRLPPAHAASALLAALLLVALPVSAQVTGPAVEPTHAALSGPAAPGPAPSDAAALGVGTPVSAVLVEASTGQVLVAREAQVRRPVASAIKLVTALVVVEALPPGAVVAIGEEVRGLEGSSYGLRAGEVRSVEDLLAGLLLRSGNDAALALAVAVAGSEEEFAGRMAERLTRLGIDAQPVTASGLATADALSAGELATVARAALAEPRIRAVVGARVLMLDDGTEVENRNLFLTDTAGASGLKTGFTSAAGYTLAASATRDGRELVAVVLGARDDRERRDLAVRLLEHGFAATESVALERSVTLRTGSGSVRFVTAPTRVTLGRGSEATVGWPPALRPDDPLREVRLLVDGADAGSVALSRIDAVRTPEGRVGLGSALADGAYAALRPVGLTGGRLGGLR
jgi:serine-type D-Ala-D-Ala carboxypeptidase (penicillin-binding protein 5/6)